jgi:hypothetical protein
MRSRLTKVAAALTLVASLAIGGATFASASSKAPSAKAPSAKAPAAQVKAPAGVNDGDNVQQGDQSTPDTPGAGESQSSSESSSESAGSEVPGNDGPGGHADEPGNPGADNQFQGEQ